MGRHGRRPSFEGHDRVTLLEFMERARHLALLCGAAAGYHSARHEKCEALQKAIDALAEDLTGDPQFYWIKPSRGRSAHSAAHCH
jgi:hypothetical protein